MKGLLRTTKNKGGSRVKKIKKTAVLMGVLVLALSLLAGCGGGEKSNGTGEDGKISGELNLFNWSEYMPQSVIDKFEEKYGVKVNYGTYSSNEEMLAKLMAGASQYDLTVASGYMVDIMVKKGLLQEIDFNNIPNFNNIGEDFKNKDFDPENKYSVAYMWGGSVIAYNTDKVKIPIIGYKDLWDPSLNNSLVVLDDHREIIGMTLKKLGYSENETDENKLKEAEAELKKLIPNIKAYDSDSPKTLLINGEAAAGLVWGAEAYLAQQENPAIKAVLPEEGMSLWQDCFVIPKDAPNKKAAEEFINFILDPEISAEISKEFPYANPNMAAHQHIDKKILENPAVYPPAEALAKGEFIKDVGDATTIYDR